MASLAALRSSVTRSTVRSVTPLKAAASGTFLLINYVAVESVISILFILANTFNIDYFSGNQLISNH